MPPVRHVRLHLEMHIDPHAARLQLPRHALRPRHIRAPHARPEAVLRIVRACDHVLLVAPLQRGKDGPEGLFGHDARGVGRVVDDGGGDEVALPEALCFAVGGGVGGPDGGFEAFRADVGEEGLDFFVLRVVLEGADEVGGIGGGADFEGGGVGDHGGEEAVVDILVDVDAFDVHADLAGVEEGEGGDLC